MPKVKCDVVECKYNNATSKNDYYGYCLKEEITLYFDQQDYDMDFCCKDCEEILKR